MSKEAMKLALGKIKSARDCHPNAVNTLLFEAEEILEEALEKPDFWEGYVPEPVKPRGEATLAQQEPVHQFRKSGCSDWYDGHPDHTDGGGPYEARTLYTSQLARHGWTTEQIAGMVRLKESQDKKLSQRTWVSLTDEEKRSVCRVGPVYAPDGVVTRNPIEYRKELQGVALMAVRKVEAKLKEKNT